ncbi:DnaB-like helicase N-terminal domain-containing protein [Prescottella subtropica]|uniref:DnaB-like helicase N-terminal domain-containing protein n=1 Tax=Prescottella subtropica TaxID=2545757 RepID=UPI0010F7AB58|nr:DnaB-like helicase N-terminal domain-containing protein [Prescottella subtropica]
MADNAAIPVPEPGDEPNSDWTAPDLDPEAHLLCAAMWSSDVDELRFVTGLVREDDFADPFHRPIYAAIRGTVAHGRPHDPVSISAELARAGTDRVPQAVHRTHRTVVTLGSSAGAVRHYAATVVAAAYRRSFHELAGIVQHAAEAASEDELFPILVELGTRQRTELRRLTTLRGGDTDRPQS